MQRVKKKINNMGIINKCRKMKKDKKKGTTVITIGYCPSVVSKGSHTDKAEGHVVLLGTAGQEGGGETYCTSVSSSGGSRRFRAVVVLCVCVCVLFAQVALHCVSQCILWPCVFGCLTWPRIARYHFSNNLIMYFLKMRCSTTTSIQFSLFVALNHRCSLKGLNRPYIYDTPLTLAPHRERTNSLN